MFKPERQAKESRAASMLTKLATFRPSKAVRWLQRSQHGLGIDIGQLQTKIVFLKQTAGSGPAFSAATIPTSLSTEEDDAGAPAHSERFTEEPVLSEPAHEPSAERRQTNAITKSKSFTWSSRDLRDLMGRIRDVVGNAEIQRRPMVGVSVSMSACDYRTIHVPKNSRMSNSSVQQTIASATGDNRNRCLAYLPGREKQNEDQQTKIRCLSLPEDLAWSVAQQLDDVGLTPKTLNGLPWCIANALDMVIPPTQRQCIQVGIDWSVGEPTLVCLVNGQIEYVRCLTNGGMQELTSQAIEDYRMTTAQAGRWLAHCLQASVSGQPNSAASETRDWVTGSVTKFAQEIETALDFIRWRNQSATLGSVWLMGGALQVPGLYEVLQARLPCAAVPWVLQTANAELSSEYALAAALARQGVQHA